MPQNQANYLSNSLQFQETFEEEGKKIFRFIASDESINIKGWKVITDGITYVEYQKLAPTVLFIHDDWSLPIGKCVGISIDGDKFITDIEFHEKDEQSKLIAWMYENGYLFGVSLGLILLKEGEPETVPPALRPSLSERIKNIRVALKSKLREISVGALVANKSSKLIKVIKGKLENTEINQDTADLILNFIDNQKTDLLTKEEANMPEIEEKTAANEKNIAALEESNKEFVQKFSDMETLNTEQKAELLKLTDSNKELVESNKGLSEKLVLADTAIKAMQDEKIYSTQLRLCEKLRDNTKILPNEVESEAKILFSFLQSTSEEDLKDKKGLYFDRLALLEARKPLITKLEGTPPDPVEITFSDKSMDDPNYKLAMAQFSEKYVKENPGSSYEQAHRIFLEKQKTE